MAQYFVEWFETEDFIKGCPKQEEVYIYPNTRSRTRDTAKAFVDGAFQSCNISIYRDENNVDYIRFYHTLFQNNTENFKQQIENEMKTTLNEVNLTESYLELNRILDIENSEICKQKRICDLSKNKTQLVYESGEGPDVEGPLLVGSHVVDAFIMSYYEGFPLENIAWGKITTEDQWELLTWIIKHNCNVRLGPLASKDTARPTAQIHV